MQEPCKELHKNGLLISSHEEWANFGAQPLILKSIQKKKANQIPWSYKYSSQEKEETALQSWLIRMEHLIWNNEIFIPLSLLKILWPHIYVNMWYMFIPTFIKGCAYHHPKESFSISISISNPIYHPYHDHNDHNELEPGHKGKSVTLFINVVIENTSRWILIVCEDFECFDDHNM